MASKEKIDQLQQRLLSGEELLSYSALSNFGESPKHFIEYKFKEKAQTDAMLYGSVVHCLILEPETFDSKYAVIPECDRRTKIGKDIYNSFLEQAGDKTCISAATLIQAQITQGHVKTNFPANNLLKRLSQKEFGIEWEYMNFKFRGFIDGFTSGKFILDLKTCADANPRKFQRDIVAMDYHLQAAMYLEGVSQDIPYYIIAVDKSEGVSVHLLDERLLNAGRERYAFLVENFNRCILLEAWNRSFDFYSQRGDGIFLCEKPSYLY